MFEYDPESIHAFIQRWDEQIGIDIRRRKAKEFLIKNGLVLLFTHKGRHYATDEKGRIIFANVKEDLSTPKDGADLMFHAIDLAKTYRGKENNMILFNASDVKNMTVADEEDVLRLMSKFPGKIEGEINNQNSASNQLKVEKI